MEAPTEIHLRAAKRIWRYLKGTVNFGIFYKKGIQSGFFGYTDSDYAGGIDDPKSKRVSVEFSCYFLVF
jgi:hypothetical protein